MRSLALLLILCGCSTNAIIIDCMPVVPWSLKQQQTVLMVQRQANNPTLDAFLMDYASMRERARQQPCHR